MRAWCWRRGDCFTWSLRRAAAYARLCGEGDGLVMFAVLGSWLPSACGLLVALLVALAWPGYHIFRAVAEDHRFYFGSIIIGGLVLSAASAA